MTAQLAAAHNYLDRGISVLPLQTTNKRPVGSWKHWQHQSMGHDTAELWWSGRIQPTPGIGIITGPVSGDLTVLDIEPEHVKFARDAVPIPDTACATTARGGLHIYCHGQTRCRKLRFEGRILGDVRSQGGYVVAPPSRLPTGTYAWNGPSDFTVNDLAELPAWATPPLAVPRSHSPVLSSRSPILVLLPSKVLRAIENPRLSARTPTWSELDYWIVRSCIWVGLDYEAVEALFMTHPIGDNALRHEERGGTDYLFRTYESALYSVQQEVDRSVWVRCYRVTVADGLSSTRGGPIAAKRALVQVFQPRCSAVYHYAIPHTLADGSLAGEWLQFLHAFGIADPRRDSVCPRGRARAILWNNEVVRFLDPGVWT